MRFADNTSVSVQKTRAELESLLVAAGGKRFGTLNDEGKASVVFSLADRSIMFELTLPTLEEFATVTVRGRQRRRTPEQAVQAWEQACRSKWRALLLSVKAKLVSVSAQIETIEEAFLPHIVVSDPADGRNKRFAEVAIKAIATAYTKNGPIQPLLPSGGAL